MAAYVVAVVTTPATLTVSLVRQPALGSRDDSEEAFRDFLGDQCPRRREIEGAGLPV